MNSKQGKSDTICVVAKGITSFEMPATFSSDRPVAVVFIEHAHKTVNRCSTIIFNEFNEFVAYVPSDNQTVIFYQNNSESSSSRHMICQCVRSGQKYIFRAPDIGYAIAEAIEGNMIAQAEELYDELLDRMKKARNAEKSETGCS